MCPDKVKNIFSHKQLGYGFRYVFVCGKQSHAHVVAAAANKWMGATGWWSNIPKMMQVRKVMCVLFVCLHDCIMILTLHVPRSTFAR